MSELNYTIVSNSCTPMYAYQSFYKDKDINLIEYTTPFISSWIPDDAEYVKFCENYDYYMSLEPRFGEPININWEKQYHTKRMWGRPGDYPVMFLGDIEIHWIHENVDSFKLLSKKYKGRSEISKLYDPIFYWSYHDMFSNLSDEEIKKLIKRFNNINRKTIFFTNIREDEYYNENTIVKFIPEWEGSKRDKYNQKIFGGILMNEILSKFKNPDSSESGS